MSVNKYIIIEFWFNPRSLFKVITYENKYGYKWLKTLNCVKFLKKIKKNTLNSSQHKMVKNFLGQTRLPFLATHWYEFASIVLRLAVFGRKINGGDFDIFIVKIRWGEHLHFYGKGRKTSTRGRFGTNGLSHQSRINKSYRGAGSSKVGFFQFLSISKKICQAKPWIFN